MNEPQLHEDVPIGAFLKGIDEKTLKESFNITVKEGDILVSRNGFNMVWPIFVEQTSVNWNIQDVFVLPISITKKYKNAFRLYNKILGKLRGGLICAEFSVQDEGICAEYGHFDFRWDIVCIHRRSFVKPWSVSIVFNEAAKHSIVIEPYVLFYDRPTIVKHVFEKFDESIVPQCSAIVELPTVAKGAKQLLSCFTKAVTVHCTEVEEFLSTEFDHTPGLPGFAIVTGSREEMEKLKNIWVPVGCKILKESEPGKVFHQHAPSVMAKTAILVLDDENIYFRIRWIRRLILDFCICFCDRLPTYVMLWIIDWIDPVFEYKQYYKVKLIDNIRASVTKILRKKGTLNKAPCLDFNE